MGLGCEMVHRILRLSYAAIFLDVSVEARRGTEARYRGEAQDDSSEEYHKVG